MVRGVWASASELWVVLLLALLPVSALASNEQTFLTTHKVAGSLSDGGSFKGHFTVTRYGYSERKGLIVDGFLQGKVTTARGQVRENVRQSVTGIPATLNEPSSAEATTPATCDILSLDIGAIDLGLLGGLVLELSPISLDLTAMAGSGNLLGSLLCGVAGLLDPRGFLDRLLGPLEELTLLLDFSNDSFR
jgi:hypothetical protein